MDSTILKLLSSNGFIQYNRYIARIFGVSEAIVLGELCSYANIYNFQEFWCTQEKIRYKTSLSERQVRQALKNLEMNKILSITKKGNPCRSWYFLNSETLTDLFKKGCSESTENSENNSENTKSDRTSYGEMSEQVMAKCRNKMPLNDQPSSDKTPQHFKDNNKDNENKDNNNIDNNLREFDNSPMRSDSVDIFDLQLSEIDKAILEQMERDSRSYLESDECLREMSNYFQADDESEDNFFDYSETQFNLDGATESSDNLSLTTDGNSETCMDKSPVAQEFQTPEKERKSPRQKKENKAVDSAKQKTTKRSKFTIQNENDSKFAKTDYESVLNAYHDNRKRLFSKNLIRISDEDYVFNYKMIMSLIKNSFEAYGVDKVIQAVKDSIKYGWLYQDGNDYPINYIFGKNILPNLINHNYGISFEKRTTPVNNYSASAPEDYKGWDDWGD